jgi:transcriptional regulator with XRE-family HTH domain
MNSLSGTIDAQAVHWPSVIRHYRLSKGLKQAALAHDLGVTQTMVSRWESGMALPSQRIQERIFDLYWSSHTSVSRAAWFERIGRHPSIVGVIDARGRILRASRGFLRTLGCDRHALEGRFIHEAFCGDLVDLYDTFLAAGFFEGRVASAESMDRIEFLGPDDAAVEKQAHGLHRPTFLPGPQIVWLLSGAEVTRSVFDEVRARIGGPRVIRKAI